MKPIMIFILVSYFISPNSTTHDILRPVQVTIHFGAPPDCNLRGFICKIDIGIREADFLQPNVAQAEIAIINKKLNIKIIGGLDEDNNFLNISNNSLIVSNNYSLPPDVCKALGISNYTIQPGTYRASNLNLSKSNVNRSTTVKSSKSNSSERARKTTKVTEIIF